MGGIRWRRLGLGLGTNPRFLGFLLAFVGVTSGCGVRSQSLDFQRSGAVKVLASSQTPGDSDGSRASGAPQPEDVLATSEVRDEGSDSDRSAARELPQLDESSGLGLYQQYAELNHPGLEAAFAAWQAELEKIPQARALPDPHLTYALYVRQVETRVGSQRHRLGLAQKLPWFGKLALRAEAASEGARVARRKYETQRLKLRSQVQEAWAEYAYLGRSLEIVSDNIELLKNWEEVARARYRAGSADQSTVLKAQLELGRLDDSLSTLEEKRPTLASRLNELLGRDSIEPIPLPGAIEDQRPRLDEVELGSWLTGNNPELAELEAEIARAQVGIKIARKDFYPDVTVGLSTIETSGALNPDTLDSGKDPILATVTVNLPVWRRKLRAGEQEARLRRQVALKRREARLNTLSAQLVSTIFDLKDAARKISLYRDTLIPLARQSLETTAASFATGQAGFFDFIDTQRDLLDLQLAYERSLADQLRHRARLELLVGQEVPLVPDEGLSPSENRTEPSLDSTDPPTESTP